MPKFNTTSTKYKVTFQDLDIRGIPNILKTETLQSFWNLQNLYACQYNVQN